MTVLEQDNGTGSNGSAWGQTDQGGGTWNHLVGSATLSRSGGELRASNNASTNLMVLGSGSQADQDITAHMEQVDGGNFIGCVLRVQDSNNFYYVDLGAFPGFLTIGKRVAGTFNDIDFFSFSYTATSRNIIKFQAIGTTIRAKVWPEGNAEPGSWSLSITDSSFSTGKYGIYANTGTTAALFDTILITDTVSSVNLVTESRAKFYIQAALKTQSRARFLTASRLLSGSRSSFKVRAAQISEARASFKVKAAQITQARAKEFVQAAQTTQARARFIVAQALLTRAKASFKVLAAQTTRARSRFLIPTHALTAPLRLAFSLIQQLALSFSIQQNLTLTFSMNTALPNSTITSTNNVKDSSGVTLTDLSAATVLVTFPDATTRSFSLVGDTITNAGSGNYSIEYDTKGVGLIKEKWDVTAADGTTKAEDLNWIEVKY